MNKVFVIVDYSAEAASDSDMSGMNVTVSFCEGRLCQIGVTEELAREAWLKRQADGFEIISERRTQYGYDGETALLLEGRWQNKSVYFLIRQAEVAGSDESK